MSNNNASITSDPEHDFQAGRPYRSHKIPACERCRKRKVRCTVDRRNQPCLFCRLHNATCNREDFEQRGIEGSARLPRTATVPRTPRQNSKPPSAFVGRQSPDEGQAQADSERGAMIVGPAAAEDIQIIEEYMTLQRSPEAPRQNGSYNVMSSDRSRPILYQSVPARRTGWKWSRSGASQREIFQQILGPLANPLIDIYFDRINPWFPVLEKSHFQDNGKLVCSALVCSLYATSLIYWNSSAELKYHPKPDITYAWNLAVAALQEEFLSPSLNTVYSALLDLGGRPITSIIGNVLTSGRICALAHSLGLNRDSSTWNITEDEKRTRTKLWWSVLIHDRWSSFAHGVPATIVKDQYDVLIPDRLSLLAGSPVHHQKGTDCFLALCSLTEILADVLPLVYSLNLKGVKEMPRKLRRIQTDLDEWEEELPDWIQINGDLVEHQAGSCSLRLSYLAVKMLISRITLRATVKSQESNEFEGKAYYQSELLKSAQTIADFICSLKPSHLQEYWLPYNAYHIASAAIVILRCAIDTSDEIVTASCKSSLQKLMNRLRLAKESDNWDIGDICLAQCNDPVTAISAAQETVQAQQHESGENMVENAVRNTSIYWESQEFGTPGFLPVSTSWATTDDLQYPWASLWDMLEPSGSML